MIDKTTTVGRVLMAAVSRATHSVGRGVAAVAFAAAFVPCAAQAQSFGMSRSQITSIEQMQGLKIDASNYKDYVTTGTLGKLDDHESLKKVFFIYNVGTKKFLAPGGYWGTHAALSDVPHPFWLQDRTEKTANQRATFPGRSGETKVYESVMKPFWDQSRIYVGSKEGKNRSNATYTYVTYSYNKAVGTGTKVETEYLFTPGYTPQGDDFANNGIDNCFENGGTIKAEIDLSGCKNAKENVLSIGTNIDTWGTSDGMYNLHIYYTKGATEKNLDIEYVDKTWGDSRRIYQQMEGTTLTVEVSKYVLKVNGHQYYMSAKIGYVKGKENQVAYFKTDGAGGYAVDADGYAVPDASLTDADGLTYVYNGPVVAPGTDSSQRFFIASRIVKHDGSYGSEGNLLGFAYKTSTNTADMGAYTDRNFLGAGLTDVKNSVEITCKTAEWAFDYTPATGDENLFNMRLDMPFTAEGDYNASNGDAPFYLHASPYYVLGTQRGTSASNSNIYYDFDLQTEGRALGEYDDIADAEMADVFQIITDAKEAQWKIVSVYDYYMMARTVEAEMKDPTDISFFILDNDFTRENGQITSWTADPTLLSTPDENGIVADSKLRIGIDKYYQVSPTDANYYNEAGVKYGQDGSKIFNDEVRNHIRYSGVCVRNGGYGQFYQTIKVYAPGWYVVGCKGMTNVGASLFVETADKKLSKTLGPISDANLAALSTSSAKAVYWPFDVSRPMYNSVALMNDPFIKEADKHSDLYTHELIIYVNEASLEKPAEMNVGVNVPQTGVDAAKQWTVFDSFRLYYGGKMDNQSYLVLDEDRTDLKYLDDTKMTYTDRTMCLNRSFNLGKWNSLILPVGLSREQFLGAFGADAELAKLSELTDTQIRFQRVTAASDDGHGNSYWLQPNTPYIIKPTVAGSEPKYTTELPTWESGGQAMMDVTAPAGHYKIPLVTLDPTQNPSYTQDETVHWNFEGKTLKIGDTDYKYVVEGNNVSGNGTMKAYGLLCRNYTFNGTGTQKVGIKGTYQMPYAYVVSDNKLVHLGKAGGASKGFRCCFVHTEAGSEAAPQLFIDGVSDGTLGIADIAAADAEAWTVAERFRGGVYNVSGQLVRRGTSTEGLGSGLYIVDGRKVMVK